VLPVRLGVQPTFLDTTLGTLLAVWLVRTLLRRETLRLVFAHVSLLAFIVVYFIVFGAGVFYILRLMSHSPQAGEEGPERGQPVRAAGITPAPAVPDALGSPGGGA